MSLELINTLATLGTFLVIGATATAAIVQLRHMRGSNQIVALNELRESYESAEFSAAAQFLRAGLAKALEDPASRYAISHAESRTDETHAAIIAKFRIVGNFYESLGILVRSGLLDRDLVLNFWGGGTIVSMWKRMAPVTAIYRRRQGSAVYENFEYIAVLAREWNAKHPHGTYPPEMRRLELEDKWLEADERYAATLRQAQGDR